MNNYPFHVSEFIVQFCALGTANLLTDILCKTDYMTE